MKKLFAFNLLLAVSFLLWACAGSENGTVENEAPPSVHPELSAQEKLLPCFQCHQESTPDIYDEWFNSLHGIGMVKCYQCHGTYENMKTEPAASDCMVCHADQTQKCSQGKKCWSCHNAHTFTRNNK